MAPSRIPKSRSARIGHVVHDSETHEDVIITEEMVSRYHAAKAKLYSGCVQITQGLADIRAHRLEDISTLSVRDVEPAIRAKPGKRKHQSRRSTEENSQRKELQRLLHDLEEELVHLGDEEYEKWKNELRRISQEVANSTQPHDDEEGQRSALDCERNHNTMTSSQ